MRGKLCQEEDKQTGEIGVEACKYERDVLRYSTTHFIPSN